MKQDSESRGVAVQGDFLRACRTRKAKAPAGKQERKRRLMHRVKEARIRYFVRRVMPGIATALETENQFHRLDGPAGQCPEAALYMEIEDNGSDTTIVAFAGMAILYAAMPKFEFKKMLHQIGRYNYVFVRDVYRSSYRRAPDGSDTGIAFYEKAVSEALIRLGARHNIAIGMSGGGEAALRISGAAPIHHVVAFNPSFPFERYGSPGNLLHALANVRTLVSDPAAYLEVLFVTLGVRYLYKRNRRLLGYEDQDRPVNDYLRRAVPVTLVYSGRCRPDVKQALTLKDIPSIHFLPVESARHNCLAELKRRGEIEEFLREVFSRFSSPDRT